MPPLDAERLRALLPEVKGWRVENDRRELHKRFELGTFAAAIAFVNRMAELAEAEGHHPDFCVRYDVLDVTLTTHAVHGLSENDFILAAKLDELVARGP